MAKPSQQLSQLKSALGRILDEALDRDARLRIDLRSLDTDSSIAVAIPYAVPDANEVFRLMAQAKAGGPTGDLATRVFKAMSGSPAYAHEVVPLAQALRGYSFPHLRIGVVVTLGTRTALGLVKSHSQPRLPQEFTPDDLRFLRSLRIGTGQAGTP